LRTITGDDEKLVIITRLMYRDFREGRHNLLLGWQICALLELEVADGSAECKITVDSAKVNEATSCADSRLFALVLRLVVER